MPIRAATTVPVPQTSIPSFVFGSPTAVLPTEPVILDPERPDDRHLTLASYRHWSQRLAHGLRSVAGLKTGNRVLFIAGNSIAWPIQFMGTIMAGGILSGVSPALPWDALVRLATGLEPAFVFADKNAIDTAIKLAGEIGLPQSKTYLFDREPIFNNINQALEGAHQSWNVLLDAEGASFDWTPFTSADQLAAINYTSGSTGFAKGVMVSHANIIANAVQVIDQQRHAPDAPERGHSHSWVMWAPFYHVIGLNQYCVIAPRRGIHNHIMEQLDIERLLKHIERYRPQTTLIMQPLMIALLSHPTAHKYDLSSVEHVFAGGAPTRQALIDRFEAFMPNPKCRVVQGWGMTEITCLVAGRNPLDDETSQCVGELLANVEIKVMAPDGVTEIIGAHKPGELWVRSPNVAKGYWRDPDKTAATFHPDGWLRTGDFGHFDEKERLFVSDRIQDIIHPSSAPGLYILPTDVEMTLRDIPGVFDVGVASVEVDVGGKREVAPRAFVVVDQKTTATTDEILRAFNAQAKPHEQLTGGLYAIKEVPKLLSGKVNRAALRAIVV